MEENTNYDLLNKIQYPEDLRKLDIDELPLLCNQLRNFIINSLSHNPGHLASSLGAIEFTVALHYVYNTPYDKIVWDVGHQAYAHKILTGRREAFSTNRQFHGLRPFPSPDESEYDTFVCGHASNSISAALGLAVAAARQGRDDEHVVAVIGDGSMSGGLAYEGLNNTSSIPNNMLIILNDNDMSIDKSVGGMSHFLINVQSSHMYNHLRYRLSKFFMKLGILNEERRKSLIRFNNGLKSMLFQQENIIEGMNIRYFGPADGHDVKELVRVLRLIKDMKGPKLLHLHTVKGKGYEPAEENACVWHAPGRFDVETGERFQAQDDGTRLYQEVFGETIVELAELNDKIVGITAAMPTGCSLSILMDKMPRRCFDVGIAEGHAVTFAGGLAKAGLQPFCCIYSAFLQRGYDNIIHDVAILRLPVVFCIDRAGLVGEDGPTHHGAFDMAFLRPIPNLTIASPYDECELRRLLFTAQMPGRGPFVIRYPRGRGHLVDWHCPLEQVEVGRGRCLREGDDVAVITIGPIGQTAAAAITRAQEQGDLTFAHYDLRFLKPLDEAMLHQIGQRFHHIVTVEDGVKEGGMGTAVMEFMMEHGYTPAIERVGLPDNFVEHGAVKELYRVCGMDEESICNLLLHIKRD